MDINLPLLSITSLCIYVTCLISYLMTTISLIWTEVLMSGAVKIMMLLKKCAELRVSVFFSSLNCQHALKELNTKSSLLDSRKKQVLPSLCRHLEQKMTSHTLFCIPGFLVTTRAGHSFKLVHANLLFLPSAWGRLPTLCQDATNSDHD